jgi:hypothetical protein
VSVRKRDGVQENHLPLLAFMADIKEKVVRRTADL